MNESRRLLLADAQTSGGLLIAASPARCDALITALADRDVAVRALIGRIERSETAGQIAVRDE